ncbi:hypothetical protein K449DRAFT_428483 [Hypoxylon sp. EC38]|nr:hypothetical protein K449DRAFT_428483 [Hypoxylon sp. EC38]
MSSPAKCPVSSDGLDGSSPLPPGMTPDTPTDFVINMPEAGTSSLIVNISSPAGGSVNVSLNNFVEFDGTESEPGVNPEQQQQQSRRSNYGTVPENVRQHSASCLGRFRQARVDVVIIVILIGFAVSIGTLAWGLAGVVRKH